MAKNEKYNYNKKNITAERAYSKAAKEFIRTHGNKCIKCGSTKNLVVHHRREDLSESEYRALVSCVVYCKKCHYKKHMLNKCPMCGRLKQKRYRYCFSCKTLRARQ
jgi:hypothetical protein